MSVVLWQLQKGLPSLSGQGARGKQRSLDRSELSIVNSSRESADCQQKKFAIRAYDCTLRRHLKNS